MIISLKADADVERVIRELSTRGLWVESVSRATAPSSERSGRAQLMVAEYSAAVGPGELGGIPGVDCVALPASRHPRVDASPSFVDVSGVKIGTEAGGPVVIGGPCSVESEDQIFDLARHLASQGVRFLRGGAFKPRTSPYSFQGHGEPALRWMRHAADAHEMRVVTEAVSESEVEVVAKYADLIQVGSRNMQSFGLLKAVGSAGRPVLLKRSMSATIEEWLLAGEYLLSHGAPGVVYCERGVRGFDPKTRNLLDLAAVAMLAQVHHVPVVVDPSHALGRRDLVLPLSRAAVAAGAAGVMVEIHSDPGAALSDGPQALSLSALSELVKAVGGVAS